MYLSVNRKKQNTYSKLTYIQIVLIFSVNELCDYAFYNYLVSSSLVLRVNYFL